MEKKCSILIVFIALFLVTACNPDCENFARVSATITPRFDLPEESYLLTTSPADFLAGRDLFTEKVVSGELVVNENTKIITQPADGGFLIRRADITEGNFNFYVRDNDCGGFIPFSTSFDCQTLGSVQTDVTPKILVPGQDVLVRTAPESFIQNRDLFVQKSLNGELVIDEDDPIPSMYSPEAGGRIATIPRDAVGNTDIFVRDEQCGGFVSLQSVRVADEEYINNNLASFVIPSTPQVIIPNPPTSVPTNLVNTWFSSDNGNYCIWFVPERARRDPNDTTSCMIEKPTLIPGNTEIGPGTPQSGSWELAAACDDPLAFLYTGNPLTGGVIDTLTGYVSFAIDRTSKGLGIERFEGSLVEPTTLPINYQTIQGDCKGLDGTKPKTMMVVTSEQTGRQLILYRFDAVPGGLSFHGVEFCKKE